MRCSAADVETDGLAGAPPVRVAVGEERHDTIDRALRLLGLGTGALVPVPTDAQGRTRVDALAERLREAGGPVIVCAQVGNVNGGAVDPVGEICDVAHQAGAWVHVDGAFGLWAAASPALRPLVAGVERADSWATDAHKWLNVPYDSGLVFCAHPAAHRAVRDCAPRLGERGALARTQLLDRFGLFGVRVATALFALDALVRAHPRAGSDAVAGEVEEIIASAHPFQELRVLAAVRAGWIQGPDTVLAELERVIGGEGGAVHQRLAQPADTDCSTLLAAAGRQLTTWQERAENPLSSRELSVAARVAVRSCEGIIADLHPTTR